MSTRTSTVLRVDSPEVLLSFLDFVWAEQRIIPLIYQRQEQYYVPNLPDGLAEWAVAQGIARLADQILGGMQKTTVASVAARCLPIPWSKERAFSDELLVEFGGTRDEFEALREFIFGTEFDSDDPVSFEIAPLKGRGFPCLLRLRNLHAFEPLADWLKRPDIFQVYYPAIYQPGSEAGGLYVEWLHEISASRVVNASLKADRQWLLLNQHGDPHLYDPSMTFQPVICLYKLQIGEGMARPIAQAERQSLSRRAIALPLSLRPDMGRSSRLAQKEEILEERIQGLQLQLDKLRAVDPEVPRQVCLYIYDEAVSVKGLRNFVMDSPISELNKFRYARVRVDLSDRPYLLHFVIPILSGEEPATTLRPLEETYRFYLDRRWQKATDADLYLPIDPAGRRLALYPPIIPTLPDQPEKLRHILLDGLLDGQSLQPGRGDLIVLWNTADRIERIFISRETITDSLAEAVQYLNAPALQNAAAVSFTQSITEMLSQKHSSVVNSLRMDTYTLADNIRDFLGKALRSDEQAAQLALESLLHDVDQTIRNDMETILDKARPEIDSLESEIRKSISDLWKVKQDELDADLREIDALLNKVDGADRLRDEANAAYTRIMTVADGNLNTWADFISTVADMHKEFMQTGHAELKRAESQLEDLLDDIGALRPDLRVLDQLLLQTQQASQAIPSGRDMREVANRLRALADQIEGRGWHR